MQSERAEGGAGAIGKLADGLRPPPRAQRARNSNLWRLQRHPLPPSAEGGDHPRQRMVEDILSCRGNAFPGRKAYPQSAYRKGGVFNLRLNTPVAKATSLFRKRNSEPLTAPSAEGALWRKTEQSLP